MRAGCVQDAHGAACARAEESWRGGRAHDMANDDENRDHENCEQYLETLMRQRAELGVPLRHPSTHGD